jgi:hypothetical protein
MHWTEMITFDGLAHQGMFSYTQQEKRAMEEELP